MVFDPLFLSRDSDSVCRKAPATLTDVSESVCQIMVQRNSIRGLEQCGFLVKAKKKAMKANVAG